MVTYRGSQLQGIILKHEAAACYRTFGFGQL